MRFVLYNRGIRIFPIPRLFFGGIIMTNIKHKFQLNAFQIKIIALITMTLDHFSKYQTLFISLSTPRIAKNSESSVGTIFTISSDLYLSIIPLSLSSANHVVALVNTRAARTQLSAHTINAAGSGTPRSHFLILPIYNLPPRLFLYTRLFQPLRKLAVFCEYAP